MESTQKTRITIRRIQDLEPRFLEELLEREERAKLVDDGDHPLLREEPPNYSTSVVQRAVQMWLDLHKSVDFSVVCNYVDRLTKHEETLPLHLKLLSRCLGAPGPTAVPLIEERPCTETASKPKTSTCTSSDSSSTAWKVQGFREHAEIILNSTEL